MDKEKIIGKAGDLRELIKLIEAECDGVIILTKMIDCGHTEIHLYNDKTLRGEKEGCGLSFSMDAFCAPSLTLHRNVALEEMDINITTQLSLLKENVYGAILIDEPLVRFKNLKIDFKALDQNPKAFFSAIYLRHRVEVEGNLSITTQGKTAMAIAGNFASTATIVFNLATLTIRVNDSAQPSIYKCQVELKESTFIFENVSNTPAPEEFKNAYVLMYGNCSIYPSILGSLITTLIGEDELQVEIFNSTIKTPIKKSKWGRFSSWLRMIFNF